jgi:hypothetical protein
MHMVLVGTRNWQPNWLRTGGEQQSIIAEPFAVSLNDFAPLHVQTEDLGIKLQLNFIIGVERVGTQRQPLFRRAAGEVIF